MPIAGATYRDGVAYIDGALCVTPVGTASITGGTIGNAEVSKFVAGTYTPTLTNSTNVAASTAQICFYERNGLDIVKVYGAVSIDPSAASSSTILRLSLPISSNLGASTDLIGVAASPVVFGLAGQVYGDPTTDTAVLQFVSDGTAANNSWGFIFAYRVL